MSSEIPKLLILERLLEPLRTAADILQRLRDDVATARPSETLLQGALVMAMAAVESALTESLEYYLRNFPQKISSGKSLSVDALPSNTAELLAAAAHREVVALGYKSFPDFLKGYAAAVSIELGTLSTENLESVQEVKATRNLVLHNGLRANAIYLEQAGPARRADYVGDKVKVDPAYVMISIETLLSFVTRLEAQVDAKYLKYTKIAAHRELWRYMFDSPLLAYDDCWEVDEAKDRIVACKRGRYEGDISNSERIFLGLWRAHFNGDGQHLTGFNMRALDSDNARKLHFFLSIARDFPW